MFARFPMGRNLLNSDSDFGRNYLNFEPPPEDAHDITMHLLGRGPTPDEIGARMMEALRTPAAPDPAGDNFPDRGPFGFVHDALAGVRDRYDAASRQYRGEGRREENVPELPWNVQIGGKNTWVSAKMGLGRGNDRAVDDIALVQLPDPFTYFRPNLIFGFGVKAAA